MTHLDTLWVRHGESTWNRAGVMQGQISWPALTPQGVRQAHASAAELTEHAPRRLISSDLARATETARIIGTRLALPVEHSPLLRERCWGVFEGGPVEAGQDADAALARHEAVPHGESRDDVSARIRRWSCVIASARGPVVVVTHGDVIREAITLWGAHQPTGYRPENGSIVQISVELPNGLRGAPSSA
jgi:broad specificity phosphatase PhoE